MKNFSIPTTELNALAHDLISDPNIQFPENELGSRTGGIPATFVHVNRLMEHSSMHQLQEIMLTPAAFPHLQFSMEDFLDVTRSGKLKFSMSLVEQGTNLMKLLGSIASIIAPLTSGDENSIRSAVEIAVNNSLQDVGRQDLTAEMAKLASNLMRLNTEDLENGVIGVDVAVAQILKKDVASLIVNFAMQIYRSTFLTPNIFSFVNKSTSDEFNSDIKILIEALARQNAQMDEPTLIDNSLSEVIKSLSPATRGLYSYLKVVDEGSFNAIQSELVDKMYTVDDLKIVFPDLASMFEIEYLNNDFIKNSYVIKPNYTADDISFDLTLKAAYLIGIMIKRGVPFSVQHLNFIEANQNAFAFEGVTFQFSKTDVDSLKYFVEIKRPREAMLEKMRLLTDVRQLNNKLTKNSFSSLVQKELSTLAMEKFSGPVLKMLSIAIMGHRACLNADLTYGYLAEKHLSMLKTNFPVFEKRLVEVKGVYAIESTQGAIIDYVLEKDKHFSLIQLESFFAFNGDHEFEIRRHDLFKFIHNIVRLEALFEKRLKSKAELHSIAEPNFLVKDTFGTDREIPDLVSRETKDVWMSFNSSFMIEPLRLEENGFHQLVAAHTRTSYKNFMNKEVLVTVGNKTVASLILGKYGLKLEEESHLHIDKTQQTFMKAIGLEGTLFAPLESPSPVTLLTLEQDLIRSQFLPTMGIYPYYIAEMFNFPLDQVSYDIDSEATRALSLIRFLIGPGKTLNKANAMAHPNISMFFTVESMKLRLSSWKLKPNADILTRLPYLDELQNKVIVLAGTTEFFLKDTTLISSALARRYSAVTTFLGEDKIDFTNADSTELMIQVLENVSSGMFQSSNGNSISFMDPAAFGYFVDRPREIAKTISREVEKMQNNQKNSSR